MKQHRRVSSTPVMRSSVVGVLPTPSVVLLSDALAEIRPIAVRARLKSSCVEFSRRVFTLWWIALFAVHFTALTYHARITKFYWRLPNSPIGEMVELYELSIPHNYSRFVAVVNTTIAIVHGVAVLRMVHNSARARQLVFFVDASDLLVENLKSRESPSTGPQYLFAWIRRVFAYKGPLGVEGKYFDVLLYTTELVETFLQTCQASRVDSLVARRWLSRVYVAVLVFNCWSAPLIHVWYRTEVAKKRLLSLMCDCLLDLFSSVVVPGALFFVYLADYDPTTHSIERTRWYDDRWLVQLWSEHELVVIASWVDAISRLLFAVGLLLSLEGVKQLLRVETVRDHPPRPTMIKRMSRQLLQLVETATSTTDGDLSFSTRRMSSAFKRYSATASLLGQLQRVRWAVIFHAALALWGVVVVGIHIAAEAKQASELPIASCPIQFDKWLGSAPVCLLVDINCHVLGVEGSASDIERQWAQVDQTSVLRVVVRHCPAFEMPRSILQFRNLKSIKLYNSTLSNWAVVSALSSQHLPAFRSLQFVRVNFTDAKLPRGLYTPAFPLDVRTVEFCVTNLHDLPSDLDRVWPSGVRLSLESSAFTSIPPVALRLLPWQLSMSGNAIPTIPAELFQSPGIRRIGMAHTPVSQWPVNVSVVPPTLRQVSIVGSHVRESLPEWMDDVIERAQEKPYLVVAVYAGDTPFCSSSRDRGEMLSGVSCRALEDEVSYPLAFEDQQCSLRN